MEETDIKNDISSSGETSPGSGAAAPDAESPSADPVKPAHKKKSRRKRKFRISSLIIVLIFLAGLGLILYPTVSDKWNSMHQTRAIAQYTDSVSNMDPADFVDIFEDAYEYNRKLYAEGHGLGLDEDEIEEYERQLHVEGSSIIGYIDIDKISCHLPIALGTDEGTLQNAVGHLEGSSLPVGGENTHTVLSGHRGLPSAKLFTDLDLMAEGDTFVLHILTETLTYEVDQILVVLPSETEALAIVSGMDYCTLLTCTPYGVNSHRMLVRGHRIENAPEEEKQVNALPVVLGQGGLMDNEAYIAAAVCLVIIITAAVILLKPKKKKRRLPGRTKRRDGEKKSGSGEE